MTKFEKLPLDKSNLESTWLTGLVDANDNFQISLQDN